MKFTTGPGRYIVPLPGPEHGRRVQKLRKNLGEGRTTVYTKFGQNPSTHVDFYSVHTHTQTNIEFYIYRCCIEVMGPVQSQWYISEETK